MTTVVNTTPTEARPRRTYRKLGLMLLALPLVAAGASLSIAQAHGPGGGGGRRGEFGEFMRWRTERMLDAVGATDAQKAKIKAAFENMHAQQKSLRGQEAALRGQLEQALSAPTLDPAAIEKLRQQKVQLMDKRSVIFTQAVVSAAQALTAAQRKELVEQFHEHGGRFGHGPAD